MSLTDRSSIYVSFRVLLYVYLTYHFLSGFANTLGVIFVQDGCEEQTQTISSTSDEYRQSTLVQALGFCLFVVAGMARMEE